MMATTADKARELAQKHAQSRGDPDVCVRALKTAISNTKIEQSMLEAGQHGLNATIIHYDILLRNSFPCLVNNELRKPIEKKLLDQHFAKHGVSEVNFSDPYISFKWSKYR